MTETMDKTARKHLAAKIASSVSQFEISRLLERAIDPFGRYQIFVVVALCLNNLVVAINHTLTTFHIYTPDFVCVAESIEVPENSTCVAGCSEYEFLDTSTSVVTEWNLVCDKRYLSALINTIYFVGVTVGSLVCGILADKWGRRQVIYVCLYMQGIFGASIYFSTNLVAFMVLRFMQGLFIQGLQGVSFTLMQELTPPRKLTVSSTLFEIIWAIGMILLGMTSYLIDDWKVLQLAVAIPTAASLAWTWLIPESPTWYLSNDKNLLAVKGAMTIAERNQDKTFLDECHDTKTKDALIEQQPAARMSDLFKNKILLKHIVVMITVWYSVTLSYYGILLFLPNLSGDRHMNFIIGALIEILAYILAYFMFSSNIFGRRYSMIIYQYLNAVFCLTLGVLTFMDEENTFISYMMVILALLGKGLAVSGFAGMFIQAAEIFPTVIRSSSLGLSGFASRIGSLTAPQIILLGEITHPAIPLGMMAAFLLVSGSATFLVPETLNKKLPNTLEDVNEAWGKKR